jgi:hypothetical protein
MHDSSFFFLIQYVNTKKRQIQTQTAGYADDEREDYILRLKSPLASYVDVIRLYAGFFHSTAFPHHVQIGPR